MVDGNDGILLHTWRVTMFQNTQRRSRKRRVGGPMQWYRTPQAREFIKFKANTSRNGSPLFGNFRRDPETCLHTDGQISEHRGVTAVLSDPWKRIRVPV